MKRLQRDREMDSLDKLTEEITVDAYGDDEKLWAFRQSLEDNIAVPCDGFVIGEPVSVMEFDYDGNERRLTAPGERPGHHAPHEPALGRDSRRDRSG